MRNIIYLKKKLDNRIFIWYNSFINMEKLIFNKNKKEVVDNSNMLLEEMYQLDQEIRERGNKTKEYFEEWKEIDKRNQEELKGIIENNGWEYLFKNNQNFKNAWTIIQHADNNPSFQKDFLDQYNKFINNNQENILDNQEKILIRQGIAMLKDRYLTNTEGFQIYGSQWTKSDDKYNLVPVLKDISGDFNDIISSLDINFSDIKTENPGMVFLDLNDIQDREILNRRRSGNFIPDIAKIEAYAYKQKVWRESVNWAKKYQNNDKI